MRGNGLGLTLKIGSGHRRKQGRDIVAALRKRRHFDGKGRKPVIQIGAKPAILDHLFHVLVGGADQPQIKFDLARAANPLDAMVFQRAQQFRLQRKRHVAHFVKKQRAAVRHLEAARTRAISTGKRSLFIAEQFGFQQFRGDGCAIDRNEWATALALAVNILRNDVFADARFTGQDHRGQRWGYDGDKLLQLHHAGGITHDQAG